MLTNSIINTVKRKQKNQPPIMNTAIKDRTALPLKQFEGIKALDTDKKQLLAKFVNQFVAVTADLPPEKLLQCNRGKAEAARARQISIYLMHTILSFSYTEIGRIYSKDRTTIAHACHVIEDLRDDESFDLKLSQFERAIGTVLSMLETLTDGVGNNE